MWKDYNGCKIEVCGIVLRCNKYTTIHLMSESLQWMSVKQRVILKAFQIAYKINYNLLPSFLNGLVTYIHELNNCIYNVRNKDDFSLLRYGKASSTPFLVYDALKKGNELPGCIRNERSRNLFR